VTGDPAGRQRVVIEQVRPEIDGGRFPIKRVIGEPIQVSAVIFADGHNTLAAHLLYRWAPAGAWVSAPLQPLGNDRWAGDFTLDQPGRCLYTIEGWIDHFTSWLQDLRKKLDAGQEIGVDVEIGRTLIEEAAKRAGGEDQSQLIAAARRLGDCRDTSTAATAAFDPALARLMARHPNHHLASRYNKELPVIVNRRKAVFSTWYERFPRSCAPEAGRHGTFRDCERLLPEIARLGFDVLYLPPVHPIGTTNRKGKNNSPTAESGEPGSPWAIGAEEGGHTALHPELGSREDFARLIRTAHEHGIEIAMDLAFQCSPDHPYVKTHPQWFRWRPDGTIQYAENPPKKYEDIVPLHFETDDWAALWQELKQALLFWIRQGIRIFRVDNPHTKPLPFWEWVIAEVTRDHPDVLFLSEAFTRPALMYGLAKAGFTQSYTYFTWRTSKRELVDYLTELTQSELREYFRPNFWPNTPDILPEHLQYGGRPAFLTRLVLAATLSSNYGIYGPPFELCLSTPRAGTEEYLDNEKYEIRHWNWDAPGNIKTFIERVNRCRRDNPALQTTWNLRFCDVDNDQLLAYAKTGDDGSNIVLTVVNLDPVHTQSGWVTVPLSDWGIGPDHPFLVHDLLSDHTYIWQGERNYVQLDPQAMPAHLFVVRKRLKREMDFDYFA
jgi:starch synthase (maltosyl-transferring)